MKMVPFPGTDAPVLSYYGGTGEDTVRAVKKHKVANGWYASAAPSRKGFESLRACIETGWPMMLHVDVEGLVRHRLEGSPGIGELVRLLESSNAGYWSMHAGEWSNWFDWDPEAIFGRMPRDRRDMYELVCATFRRWAAVAQGHINSLNGYGLIFHIGAEVGEDFVAGEVGENIPATQVAYAFARGAARQFGIPWHCEVSPWIAGTITAGCGERVDIPPQANPADAWGRGLPKYFLDATDIPPGQEDVHWWYGVPKAMRARFNVNHDYAGSCSGPDCGHSESMFNRFWHTAWFAGASNVDMEGAGAYVFEVPRGATAVPEDVRLSKFGRRAQKLFALMQDHTEGVAYTPFAVLVSKYHGHMTFWGKPWRIFEPTEGDEMTVRFFDQVFPGQSTGPGREESYLCPSPYGDTFDVFVNRADLRALRSYPVVIAVGDMPWDKADVHFLRRYVKAGGTLALNETQIDEHWDRSFLGLAEGEFTPNEDARVALADADGRPLLIRRDFGAGGRVFVAARCCEPNSDVPTAVPNALLDQLADEYLPVRIDGPAEFLIRRTPEGWAIMLVNNNGFHKEPTEPPVIDPDAPRRFVVSWVGEVERTEEWTAGQPLEVATRGRRRELAVEVEPGELKVVHLVRGDIRATGPNIQAGDR